MSKPIFKSRIGNDLTINWDIFKSELSEDGQLVDKPYDLTGKDLRMIYCTAREKSEIKDFSVNGNTIIWTFAGKDQKFVGKYTITLYENFDKSGMVALDQCNAFELTLTSCAPCCPENGHVKIESVNLTSSFNAMQVQPIIPEIKDGFWWIDGENTGLKAQGPKGDPLKWNDLTPDQKKELKGDKGDPGNDGKDGFVLYPKFSVNDKTHLFMETENVTNQVKVVNGHFKINV